jgi:hypothetical protein
MGEEVEGRVVAPGKKGPSTATAELARASVEPIGKRGTRLRTVAECPVSAIRTTTCRDGAAGGMGPGCYLRRLLREFWNPGKQEIGRPMQMRSEKGDQEAPDEGAGASVLCPSRSRTAISENSGKSSRKVSNRAGSKEP